MNLHNPDPPARSLEDQAVLITGCSSGIGRASAVYLARQGLTVFATVRKEPDAQALLSTGLPNLVPVCPLDLAHPEHISPAAAFVRAELDRRGIPGLSGLVNNAGGGSVAPVELMNLDMFRGELLARLAGPVGLLQACLPMLRQSRGRVVWIVTPALLPVPYVSSIHACDFAANCLIRTLNLELKPWGIPAIMIRCGGIKTAAVDRTVQEVLDDTNRDSDPERFALYAGALRKNLEGLAKFDQHRSEPEAVARVVFQALTARKPRLRYSVGYMAGFAAVMELLPQGWVDYLIEKRG